MEIAILGLGCFWGPEIKFSKLDGVIKTEVGYCGGHNAETNYKEVCTGTTNHAEVVKLDFDPKVISYEKSLEYFFMISKIFDLLMDHFGPSGFDSTSVRIQVSFFYAGLAEGLN